MKSFPDSRLRLILVLFSLMLLVSAGPLKAVSLDRLFPQRLDQKLWAGLRASPGRERAVFLEIAGGECIMYARASGNAFIVRGQLTGTEEKWLAPMIFAGETTVYAPLKENGEPLYQRGRALTGKLQQGTLTASFCYVPHRLDGRANDCFVCDRGYLEISLQKPGDFQAGDLETVIGRLFDGRAKISDMVKLNRYYLYRDNFWGPVDQLSDNAASDAVFAPLHKATLHKSVADHGQKLIKDCELVTSLLTRDHFLLSQDMRCKLGRVPGFVKVNMADLDNTDIGSGQNQLIFLSSGPGINYFDDPWLQPRKNVPCPRLIFHRSLYNLRQMQLYPTYSIEPQAKGEGRLLAINDFQNPPPHQPEKVFGSIVWSPELDMGY